MNANVFSESGHIFSHFNKQSKFSFLFCKQPFTAWHTVIYYRQTVFKKKKKTIMKLPSQTEKVFLIWPLLMKLGNSKGMLNLNLWKYQKYEGTDIRTTIYFS